MILSYSHLVEWGKRVGCESRRSFLTYLKEGFFDRFMQGVGIEIGYRGYENDVHPILPECIGVDLDYPGYDGKTLPFETGSVNYVYSSHCLEHISNFSEALNEWMRVVRVGGYLIVSVPHAWLYEKKKSLPSYHNADHKRLYTPASLLLEIEQSLPVNSYRVRYLSDNDTDFDYSIPPGTHSHGTYEITVVLQKIERPNWELAE